MNEILVKKSNSNVNKELNNIGFDNSYISFAEKKYIGNTYKILNLKPYEANILKQLCLSLGFDCAINRNSVTCKCELTDALIFASESQIKNLIKKLLIQPFRLKNLAERLKEQLNIKLQPLILRNSTFDWSNPYIMGILNVTPDSFSDGGKYNSEEKALAHCSQMIKDGADIIDIGGESTRPGAKEISAEEEIMRVIPIIRAIRNLEINIPISIDTRNYLTAKAAIDEGADIINDVSGLDFDIKLKEYVISNNLPFIIMHSDKVPAVSRDYTSSDIVEDVFISLYKKINNLIELGMKRNNIIADVGIGFGKATESNFEILKRHDEFTSLNVPILLGISRKTFIRNKFNVSFEDADEITALYSSIVKGVNIHRVHNVALTKKFLNYTQELF
ncbi:dihydropteroate synthase [bacterium]|nr:dihydropteroate synthase [bacterium]